MIKHDVHRTNLCGTADKLSVLHDWSGIYIRYYRRTSVPNSYVDTRIATSNVPAHGLKTKVFFTERISQQNLRMDPIKCQVYTTKGTQCSKNHKMNSQYCGLHETKREETGPHRYANEQLSIKQKFEVKAQFANFSKRREQAVGDRRAMRAITNEETIADAHMEVRHREEVDALLDSQRAEIAANGGRDPDEMANTGREIKKSERDYNYTVRYITIQWNHIGHRNHFIGQITAIRERLRIVLQTPYITPRIRTIVETLERRITLSLDGFMARAMQDLENREVAGWGGEPNVGHRMANGVVIPPNVALGALAMALPPLREQQLARLANDNQNVHTTLIVDQTKKNVAEILKISVPEEYRWNTTKLSQTYIQIIVLCQPSPKSVWQFSSMYCSDATIYDMEPGIFGKVVDGVWQYIRNAPDEHKLDLRKILRTELRDNIGMCAQGNLSRICNVLQGYMEGIGQKEPVSTILGREFPKLMEIENVVEREARGAAILRENQVPEAEWESWLDPLRS